MIFTIIMLCIMLGLWLELRFFIEFEMKVENKKIKATIYASAGAEVS